MATGPRLFHVRIGPDGSAESAPMTASAVKALVAKGLPANAVIREAGTARWHLISTVKGLAAAPIETAPAFDWRTTPLVRVSSSYANFVSHRIDDVIGVFPDGVMTFRKQRHVPLPQEIGVSVGTSQLGDVRTLGARRTATWAEVLAIDVTHPISRGTGPKSTWMTGRELRITFVDRKTFTVFLHYHDADHLVAAFGVLAGRTLHTGVPAPLELKPRAVMPRVVLLLAAIPVVSLLLVGVVAVLSIPLIAMLNLVRPARCGSGRRSLLRVIAATGVLGPMYIPVIGLLVSEASVDNLAGGFVWSGLALSWAYGFWALPNALNRVVGAFATRISDMPTVIGPRPPRRIRWFDRTICRRVGTFRSPWVSWSLKATGCLLFFAAILFIDRHDFSVIGEVFLRHGGIQILLLMPSVLLIYVGYRAGQRSAPELLESDQRQPIVYLRSFKDDGHGSFNHDDYATSLLGLGVPNWLAGLGPFANSNPIRLLRLCFSRGSDTAEEQLAGYLGQEGPFVAIGEPGEGLPTGGAARDYVSHEVWKERVGGWIQRARFLVIQPGETNGIWWEIDRTLSLRRPQEVLFCLLALRDRQHEYECFAIEMRKRTGVHFPMVLGTNAFMWIRDGRAHYRQLTLASPFAWPVRGCVADFRETLADFLNPPHGTNGSLPVVAPKGANRAAVFAAAFCWLVIANTPTFVVVFGAEVLFPTSVAREALEGLTDAERINSVWGGLEWSVPMSVVPGDGVMVFVVPEVGWFGGFAQKFMGDDASTQDLHAANEERLVMIAGGGEVRTLGEDRMITVNGISCIEGRYRIADVDIAVVRTGVDHGIQLQQWYRIDEGIADRAEPVFREALDRVRVLPQPGIGQDFTVDLGDGWTRTETSDPSFLASYAGPEGLEVVVGLNAMDGRWSDLEAVRAEVSKNLLDAHGSNGPTEVVSATIDRLGGAPTTHSDRVELRVQLRQQMAEGPLILAYRFVCVNGTQYWILGVGPETVSNQAQLRTACDALSVR